MQRERSGARRSVGVVAQVSAGVVLYRRTAPQEAAAPRVEVLCAHMGGPLWARKDEHAWSFPKGVIEDGEDELAAARREFGEEIGVPAPDEPYRRLGEYRYSSGKLVVLFAAEADLAVDEVHGGTFEMEWPPRSGRRQEFPEIDRAAWVDLPTARTKLVVGQAPALDDLERLLDEAT
jgi:predicted NUDIX family NTP pyrophosphohydrolase